MRRIRCAIYTRKSSEEGLEQEFNSLDAQREACSAFITSQKHEGWELLADRYDDGGISGGHLDRPALQSLMQMVDEKQVDQIVVYKIDRLTRSLADFAKLVERLDAAGASFVSVTQSFNTATSMGRLTLNVLLSFAQFEREVTAERIRDKIASSKRKGMWMGGNVPIGYQAKGRTLMIDEEEATTVRALYELYVTHGNICKVTTQAELLELKSRQRINGNGCRSGGGAFDRGHVHYILTNPVYAGRIRHKDQVHEGQHDAIIEAEKWEHVQQLLKEQSARIRGSKQKGRRSPLVGKIFDETGDRLTPSHSKKDGKRLRYYISRRLVTDRSQKHPDAWRLPGPQLEALISDVIGKHCNRSDAVPSITRDLPAAAIQAATERLENLEGHNSYLSLLERADLQPGLVKVQLSQDGLAEALSCELDEINLERLVIEAPFQTRRRGVELKLYLGNPPPEADHTLIRNIVNARRWLALIIEGETVADIARDQGITRARVHDIVKLALLSPDVLEAIASGEQPDRLTTDYLIKTGFSAVWSEQSEQFSAP
ncbi:MAG: recombinase family protein [Rhizobiaceae bacterium]